MSKIAAAIAGRYTQWHNAAVQVLLVEDDPSIATTVADGLRSHGFDVTSVGNGRMALAATDYDIVLLDLGLPDLDGAEVCRRLRQQGSTVPIIMLTARSEEFDRVLGFELGADDYVTKPFSLRELVARIRAVARRSAVGSGAQPDTDTNQSSSIGPLTIDRRTRRVHLGDHEVVLTAKEFDLLAYLATDTGAVHTRTEILEHVWDAHWYGPTKTVDAHVAAVRKKLGDARWVQAVRGVGFRLEAPTDASGT